jgi:hypothetical protein
MEIFKIESNKVWKDIAHMLPSRDKRHAAAARRFLSPPQQLIVHFEKNATGSSAKIMLNSNCSKMMLSFD